MGQLRPEQLRGEGSRSAVSRPFASEGAWGLMVAPWPVPAEVAGGWLGSVARALKGRRDRAGKGVWGTRGWGLVGA